MKLYDFKKIWNPVFFQGNNKDEKYFEGWYFKIVDKKEKNIFGIIPGVSIEDNNKRHSFIQIIDGVRNKTYYINYTYEDFTYNKKEFHIKIGNNIFTNDKVILDIRTDDLKINGTLEFKDMYNWPIKLLSPGVMGWYRFMPFMECYHGVISMNHRITGKLFYNDNEISFDGGLGYIEKDWGVSFPKSWIWAQSNHFDKENVSIFLSIANIPFVGREFNGFLIGLLLENKLYRFTTYTGAKIKELNYNEGEINIKVVDSHYILKINIVKFNTANLISPKNGNMIGRVEESLSSIIEIELIDKSNQFIFKGVGRNTGLEIKGKLI
ncbi:hypothetical protein GOQ27_02315 [Clostridium sp. D2Q-11]|uniref:Tocopherol cyclase n=1 Tax=Anaeromonas frigoriresistens TaxID=2683708 RepID=A0A942Z7T4_9FIRM|nr:tocopherol cyclase family protein [Anaeromonas frigoriresistens]MBS4537275.1 hypothetical protein [Anaeromonas frigoriresistens]